jgi:predicted O-methyltransferase YrrM
MLKSICEIHAVNGMTDRSILQRILQPKDEREEYLSEKATYAWHLAIGEYLRPKKIGEIGVRFGYSLYALACGAIKAGCRAEEIECHGYDRNGVDIANANITSVAPASSIRKANTQLLDRLDCDADFDLFHVDGDHSERGALHDMKLAWAVLRRGGTMLVDDYHFLASVRRAVVRWATNRKMGYIVLPTFRGTAVFLKG